MAGLGCISIEDMRKREISTLSLLLLGGLGVFLSLLGGEWKDISVLCRFLPGLIFLGLGKISRESIGYGDGFVILCLGSYLTVTQLLGACMTAVTLAGVAALFLMILLHRGRRTQIPFVPFLFIGCGITILSQGVS